MSDKLHSTDVFYAGFIPVDGVYAVLFPDLPGCNSQGHTLKEALSLAREAISDYVKTLLENDEIIPLPSSEQVALQKLEKHLVVLGYKELPNGTELHPVPYLDKTLSAKQIEYIQIDDYREVSFVIFPNNDEDINTITVKNLELATGVKLIE